MNAMTGRENVAGKLASRFSKRQAGTGRRKNTYVDRQKARVGVGRKTPPRGSARDSSVETKSDNTGRADAKANAEDATLPNH